MRNRYFLPTVLIMLIGILTAIIQSEEILNRSKTSYSSISFDPGMLHRSSSPTDLDEQVEPDFTFTPMDEQITPQKSNLFTGDSTFDILSIADPQLRALLSGNADANGKKQIENKENTFTKPEPVSKPVALYNGEERVIGYLPQKPVHHPGDEFFYLEVKEPLTSQTAVYLEYDLYGVEDNTQVSRSINDQPVFGGYVIKQQNSWSKQSELINPGLLKQGINTIRFSIAENAAYSYKVKNLKLRIAEEGIPDKDHSKSIVVKSKGSTELHIEGDELEETGRRLIINQPTTAYYYRRFGYVQGFVTGQDYDKALIRIGGQKARAYKGEFESLVSRNSQGQEEATDEDVLPSHAPWNTTIEAVFPDGEILKVDITFEKPAVWDHLTGFDANIHYAEEEATENESFELALATAALQGEAGSLQKNTTLSITALRSIDLPRLNPGMVNVTADYAGYRFLPHGSHFGKPLNVTLGYDSTKLPRGHYPQEIRTYYYDESHSHWVALPRDSVNKGDYLVCSRTTHFTDMINAIVKAPEMPETQEYTPTSLKELQAADPSSGIQMMQPPTANSQGTASLSYPIHVPAGRQGMQPNLAISYSSEAANGLLGMGWDMQIPAITVDTKWGVPRYDSQKETETYLYNGEELLPSARLESSWKNRNTNGSKKFYPRVEGGFEKIERHKNKADEYFWIVTDKQGTQYYYGTYTGNECDPSVLLKDKDGNIAHWPLCKVIDINSNYMQYCYEIREQTQGGITLGQQLWLASIIYTGHDNTHGESSYKVVFSSEANMTPEQMQDLGCTLSGSRAGAHSSNFQAKDIPLSDKGNKSSTASASPDAEAPAEATGSKGPECNIILRKTDRHMRVLDNVEFDLGNGTQLVTDYIGNTPSFVMHEGECFDIHETNAPRCCALLDHPVTICVMDNCNIDVQPSYPVHQETVNGEVFHVVTIINTCDCSDYNYHTPTVVRKVDQNGRVLEGVIFRLDDVTDVITNSSGYTSPFFIPSGGSMRIDEIHSLDCCEPLPYPIHITDNGNGNFDVEHGFPVHQETVNGMLTNVITIENRCSCPDEGLCQTIIRKIDKEGRTIQGVEFQLNDGRRLTTDETGSTQSFGIREGDHITIHEIQTLECCHPSYLPIEIYGYGDCNIEVHPRFPEYPVYQEWRNGVLFNIITIENDCHCPDDDTRLNKCQTIIRKVDQYGNVLENVVFISDNGIQYKTNKDGNTSFLDIGSGGPITIHEVSTLPNCTPVYLPFPIYMRPDCEIHVYGYPVQQEMLNGMRVNVIYVQNTCDYTPTNPCKLRIKKVNANGNVLQGAVFRASNGSTLTSNVQGYTSVINLQPGTTITLSETQAPSGYQLNTQTIRIDVLDHNCNINITPGMPYQKEYVEGEECYVLTIKNTPVPPPSNPCKLRIKKVDANGHVLQGAVFQTSDGSTLTSDSQGYTSSISLQPGTTLTLTETQAPSGYQPGTQSVQIEVLANCSIRVTPSSSYQIEQVGNERYWVLKIKNDTLPPPSDPCNLRIKKVDKNGNPLQGAVFETADGLVCSTDAGGFTSDIPLEPGKTIELVETQAPSGYKRSTKITRIEVLENCSIRVTPAMDYRVEQQGNEQFYVMTIVNDSAGTPPSIVDTNECNNCQFRIRKVNEREEGLAGAVFQIEGGGTITTGSEGYSSYLPLNKISFHETTPPAGYKLNAMAIKLRADEHCNATMSTYLKASMEKEDDCHWVVTIENENESGSYYYIHKIDKHTGLPIQNAGFGDETGSAFTDTNGNTRRFPLIPGQSFRIEEFHVPQYYDTKDQAFAEGNVTANGDIEVNGNSQMENLYQDANGDWVFVFSNVNLRPGGYDTTIYINKRCTNKENLCPCNQNYQPDLTINARYGFRQSSKDKLTKIVVFYGEECVRSYDFCYTTDYFGRAQLQAVTQWSSLDTAGEKHMNFMEYFEGPEYGFEFSQPVELGTEERYDIFLDKISGIPKKLKNKFSKAGFKPSLLGGSRTWSFGINGGADIGLFPAFPLKTLSAGLYFSTGATFSKGRSTLMDINGDGLPDQVYSKGKVVHYRLQIPGSNTFGEQQTLEGIENFLQDKSTNFSFGFQASAGAHGGYQKGFGSSETKVYFSDINGDGFPDLVHPNGVKYIGNHQNPPVYTLPECLPPVISIDTEQLSVVCDTMPYIEPYTEITSVDAPQYDFVRVWVADLPDHPNLRYKIGGRIYFVDSVGNETDMDYFYGEEDSLVLSIQWHKYNGTKWIDTLLWIDTVGRADMINMGTRGWNTARSSQGMAVMGATGSSPATSGVSSSPSMPLSMPVIPPGPGDTTIIIPEEPDTTVVIPDVPDTLITVTPWITQQPDIQYDTIPTDGIGKTLLDSLHIRRGDTLYFRVHALRNGVNRALVWDPSIKPNMASFNTFGEENDENGKMFGGGNSAAESQLLQSDSNFYCPFDGRINISYTYGNLMPLLDTVYYEIRHNKSIINRFMIPPGGYYALNYDYISCYGQELSVRTGDTLGFKVLCGSNVNHINAQWNPKVTYTIAFDPNNNINIGNKRDTLLYRPAGDTLEYEIAPYYQYYHKILHLDYNHYMYSLPGTTQASVSKIKVFKESTWPFDTLLVPARFTVTQPDNGNKHLYAETVTMGYAGGFRQLNVPVNAFILEADKPFYVSCFVPGEWAWCIRDSCYITINGTDYKCAVYTQEQNNTLWGGMYGRWGQFQYMSDDLPLMDKSKIFMSAAYQLGLSSDSNDVDFYAGVPTIANSLTDLESKVKNGYDKIYTRNFKSRLSSLPMNNRIQLTSGKGIREHQGYYPNSFIHKSYVYIGGLPVFNNIEDPDEPGCDGNAYPVAGGNNGSTGTGSGGGSNPGNSHSGSGSYTGTTVKGYSKFSTSSTDSYSYGISIPGMGLGTSKTETHTKQLSDMMDLNGDGFPDIIRGGSVQYSKPFTGQWESSRTVFTEGCHHYSTMLNITRSFTADPQGAIREAKNSGKGKTALTKTPRNSGYTPQISATANKSKTYAEDITHYTLMDVNGDGLPDRVYHQGNNVALNTGYGFEPREYWNLNGTIGSSISNAGSASFNLGFSGARSGASYSFSAGLSGSQSYSQHKEVFVDMNNDGLPDRIIFASNNEIHIMFNSGIGNVDCKYWIIKFVATDRPDLCRTSVTKSISGTVCITLGFPIVWWAKVSASAGAEGAFSISSEHLSFIDMNGDGYADIVFNPKPSDNENNKLYVMYSQLGKTGLLKKVTNPLGGTIEMDYALTDATVMHSRRQVLSEVKIKANHANDPGDVMLTSYTYESGYYDRRERVFYGFAKVTEKQHDTRNSNTVLRMVTKYYHNANSYNKGLSLGEVLADGAGKTYILTRNKWSMRNPNSNMDAFTPVAKRAYPALDTTVTCYYEGESVAQIRKEETYRYDTYGRPVSQTSTSTDMPVVEVSIKYDHPEPGNYNISIPSEVIVHPPGQPQQFYRKRTTGINTSTGQLTSISDYYDNSNALTTSMSYDSYGNCTFVQYPNHSVTVGYENILHTYPEYVTNDFNETSWMAEYDYRFGIPLVTRDIHGNDMRYTLDEWGRIATIQSPKEYLSEQSPYTVKYEYFGSYCPYNASLNTPYKAKTSHFDVQHPGNDIETYTFCDGLGRIVQTKVDASINGQEQMIVSGKVIYDALGRVKETYLPGVCPPGDFVFAPDGYVPAATSTYDVLDRPLLQIAHDGTSVQYKYGFGNSQNCTLFQTEVINQNGNTSINLANVNQQQYEVQPAGYEGVWFEYNPVGDLIKVSGHDFDRNYQYDKLGRRTVYWEGNLYEHYAYDGENMVEKQIQWYNQYQGRQEAFLYYEYQSTRLSQITQSRLDMGYNSIIKYYYDIGSKPVRIDDESGIQLFEYGNMGETTKQTRIYTVSNMSFSAIETQFEYDSWGRTLNMTYPDGEIVTYGYDYGGQLINVHGDKGGQSYSYLEDITYNEYGAKTAQIYGNQLITFWQYNPYNQRLEYQQIRGNYGQDYLTTEYYYDNIGNITEMRNNHYMGNYMFTRHQFGYDAANQLVRAIETDTYLYDLTIEYGDYGKMKDYMLYCQDPVNIVNQARHSQYQYNGNQSNNFAADYSDEYTYYNGMQYSSPVEYSYGINGSIRQKYIHRDENGQSRNEFYLFDAYGNMNAYCDNWEKYAYYSYDDAGQRTCKMTFNNVNIGINAQRFPVLVLDKASFYPNGFININQYGEYTKHYYAESQRIASKIGNGFGNHLCEDLAGRYNVYPHELEELRNMLDDKTQRDFAFTPFNETWVDIDYGNITICELQGNGVNNYEDALFFYHGNHLSSTQMITHMNGDVIQQVQYAPFGEIISEYNAYWHSDLIPNYTFNAKELDEESGMYYFEARYLKPPSFISRDPLFEKYFWMSPYAYCMNNPVIYIDPDGRKVKIAQAGGEPLTYIYDKDAKQGFLYDSKGSTVQGDQFAQDVKTDLDNIMSKGGNLTSRLDKLITSDNTHTITSADENQCSPSSMTALSGGKTGSTVYYNRGNSSEMKDIKGYRSSLVHELLGHGYSADQGTFGKGGDIDLGNGYKISSEQLRAINIQNIYNRHPSINLPLRTTDKNKAKVEFNIPLQFLNPKK